MLHEHAKLLTERLKVDHYYHREFTNSLIPLISLEERIINQIKQIDPLIDFKNRHKRGLLNPLGSLIKCITGNLDNTDAEKYDKQIRLLEENQNKIKTDQLNQITVLEYTVTKFRNLISNLTHNDLTLKSRILQAEQAIKNVTLHQNTEFEYVLIHITLNQITSMYQIIYDIFERIEMAITFAKINTLHNSIVNPLELLNEIRETKIQLTSNALPLDVTKENLLSFERIIEIKSYSKNLEITFILELPLVEPKMYQYFQLFSLPTPSNEKFKFHVIIPHKPFLALEESKYSYMDQKCVEISSQQYLCKETHAEYLEDNSPCATQLIAFKQNVTTCQAFPIQLNRVQATKIMDSKWLITVPTNLKSTIVCDKVKNNKLLHGSYLLESTEKCEVQISSFIFKEHKPKHFKYQSISLPMLNLSLNYRQSSTIFNPSTLNLDTINLEEIKKIQNKLEDHKLLLAGTSTSVYLTKTSLWTILIYILFIIILIFLIIKKLLNYIKKPPILEECIV